MNKEKLSIGNIIWNGDCAWIVWTINQDGIIAYRFGDLGVGLHQSGHYELQRVG